MNNKTPMHNPAASNVAGQTPVHRAQQVLQSLAEDRADLLTMNRVLDDERNILDRGEHAQLQETAQQKLQLATRLDARYRLRAKLLPKLAEPAGATSDDAATWGKQLDLLEKQSGVALTATWQEIETLLRQSDEKLRVNEKIVASLQGNVNRFINELRAQAGGGKTYSADGKEKTYSSGTPLGSA